MHVSASSAILLSLLSLSTPTLGVKILGRRHAHLEVAKIRREPGVSHGHDERAFLKAPVSGGKKGKRLIRKKKRATCQVSFSNTTTSVARADTMSVTAPLATATLGQVDLVPIAVTTAAATTATTSTATTSSATPTSSSSWYHVDTWSGNTFFNNFNFWSWDDPTHGTVQFLDAGDAWNSGLISINSAGNAMMKVDTAQTVSNNRRAIRIHGNKVWTGGMVIMDAVHMPTGCGTWPAWWQNGPNWPYGGEIDILEGINTFTQNQVSLHTGSGCTMPNNQNNLQSGTLTTGGFDSYNCASYETANQGCGVRDTTNDNSYGSAFNNIGGGVYAMLWGKAGIKVWWFPRNAIPSDISNDAPDPSNWGTPVADFPSDSCDPYQYFYDHYNIFDTTLCGDWAGADAVWKYAGYAGQSQSCAAITGYSTCSDYVRNQGSAFADAYWEVSYVKYFNSTTEV